MFDQVTLKLNVDPLILSALREDITSDDVSTNSIMKKPQAGEVDLICKQDGIICGLQVFERVFTLLDDTTKVEFFAEAMDYIAGRAEVEVSGNVTKENISRLTDLGVDFISSGALTHSAPIMDISLKNLHAV